MMSLLNILLKGKLPKQHALNSIRPNEV